MTWRQWVALIVATVLLSALWIGVSAYGGSKVDRYLLDNPYPSTTTTIHVDFPNTVP